MIARGNTEMVTLDNCMQIRFIAIRLNVTCISIVRFDFIGYRGVVCLYILIEVQITLIISSGETRPATS